MFAMHGMIAACAVLLTVLSFAITVRSHARFAEAESRRLDSLSR